LFFGLYLDLTFGVWWCGGGWWVKTLNPKILESFLSSFMQLKLLQQKENYGCSILRASIELYLFVCTSEINLSFGLVSSVRH
jgi:hypothetical protein